MAPLFHWPNQTVLGRVVTKKKLFEKSPPNTAVRELFTRQVDKIIWLAKLAESTVNLASSPEVPEIHIFALHLKDGQRPGEVLRFLDRAIPFPLIFELHNPDKVSLAAALKRPGPPGDHQWLVGDYYYGPWLAATDERQPLPVALDLKGLYGHILAHLWPTPARPGESIGQTADRLAKITTLENKMARLEARLNREKQFNRRVEINGQLQTLHGELAELTQGIS